MRYKFLRSNVPGKAPTLAQLPANEMAVNTADRVLYFNTGSEVIKIQGHSIYNASFVIDFAGPSPIITVPVPFVASSTRLYIGGQRQMLVNDYTESSSTTLTILSGLTEAAFNSGGNNVVLDYDPA